MIPAAVVFVYLGVVLAIGAIARRSSARADAEEYFLAGRSLGAALFLLSLLGANMTAASPGIQWPSKHSGVVPVEYVTRSTQLGFPTAH